MLILAIYYTLADVVLLAQCLYYKGFSLQDEMPAGEDAQAAGDGHANERTGLLPAPGNNGVESQADSHHPLFTTVVGHHAVASSFLHPSVDSSHLSPAMPFVESAPKATRRRVSRLQSVLFNMVSVVMVCMAGIVGWWISVRSSKNYGVHQPDEEGPPKMDVLGQIFGYLCAVMYLGSRFPQILLNFRRKSTEGVSLLFFLFACIGNSTYVLSILAYTPVCEKRNGKCHPGEASQLYWWYILVNLSWLLVST